VAVEGPSTGTCLENLTQMAADFAEALDREVLPRESSHRPGGGSICVLLRNRRTQRLVFFLVPTEGDARFLDCGPSGLRSE